MTIGTPAAFRRSCVASTPSISMYMVPEAPIGLPPNAGYSLIATAASLKKISTGPPFTDANTRGDCSGTVNPRAKPSTFS